MYTLLLFFNVLKTILCLEIVFMEKLKNKGKRVKWEVWWFFNFILYFSGRGEKNTVRGIQETWVLSQFCWEISTNHFPISKIIVKTYKLGFTFLFIIMRLGLGWQRLHATSKRLEDLKRGELVGQGLGTGMVNVVLQRQSISFLLHLKVLQGQLGIWEWSLEEQSGWEEETGKTASWGGNALISPKGVTVSERGGSIRVSELAGDLFSPVTYKVGPIQSFRCNIYCDHLKYNIPGL